MREPGEEETWVAADRLVAQLAALEEGSVRSRAAARALRAMDPPLAAAVLRRISRGASETAPRNIAALAAIGSALLEQAFGLGYEERKAVYEHARALGWHDVTALFLELPAKKTFEEPRDKDPRLAQMTLGHKKMIARQLRDPDLQLRLAAEGDPRVVRELLANPQLTEAFVIRLAARRPCRPETLRVIFDDARWRTRPAIKLALAKNPYTETSVVLKLLPQLTLPDLRELAHDSSVHEEVRAASARLVAARRPGVVP